MSRRRPRREPLRPGRESAERAATGGRPVFAAVLSPATPRGRLIALLAVLALAAAVRIYASPPVYTAEGVRLGPDSDPYYHVLRARELAVRGRILWRDPGMNYPEGADVLWPPGFDALLAGVAWATALGTPTDAWVERTAPAVAVALGVLAVGVVALAGAEIFGGGLALGAALLLTLLHPHLQYTSLQRPDQHAAELALFAAVILTFARALRPGRRAGSGGGAIATGASLALAFWVWQGSAVVLLVLGAFVAAWHVIAPEDGARARAGEALAVSGAVAALLLAGSIVALGPPGALASGSLTGISGLAPALCLAGAVFGAVLSLASRRPGSRMRRLVEVAAAAGAPVALLVALPGTREGILHGLSALAAANPWYARIREYQPLIGSGTEPLLTELGALPLKFGLAPIAAAIAVPSALRLAREPERGARASFLLVATAILLALTLARHRFEMYLALPLALLAAPGVAALARRWAPAHPAAAGAGLWVAVVAPMLTTLPALRAVDPDRDAVIQVARQLGEVHTGEPRGVLAGWDRGHDIRYFSGLPVLATPFGTDLGPHALDDSARFWLSRSEDEARRVLAERRVRWLVLEAPEPEVALAQALLGRSGYVDERRSATDGATLTVSPAGASLVPVRLYRSDGVAGGGAPALAGFRLVQEVAGPGRPSIKVYEVVAGATLAVSHAEPRAPVAARAEIVTPDGRRFVWAAQAIADAGGTAQLGVPYATGANGAVAAGPYAVSSGGRGVAVEVGEAAVRSGANVPVLLP